jgi:hypothetical protein
VQALQTHYRHPVHFHQRMERGHLMINPATKGDFTSVHRNATDVLDSKQTRDLRVPSQTTYHIPRMEVHYEDPVNPRGSHDCSFTVYFGVG